MMAVENLSPLVGVVLACAALAVSRATMHRRTQPVATHAAPRSPSPRALSADERSHVLGVLRSARFVDQAPAQVVYRLLDEGEYLCSVRSMYRILAANAELRERRNQARHPVYAKPELLATAPNQVWSWDITALRGPGKANHFYLYVILDIFSRKTVGWMVAHKQCGSLAERLIRETCKREGIDRAQRTVHSDRGTQMKSKVLAQLYADLDILASFSRPQVSDDNPFSESAFKTLKYCAEFPDHFSSLNHARRFCATFFDTYNEHHRHSGLRHLTPNQVHSGAATTVVSARQAVLDIAHAKHPERFVRGASVAHPPPAAVYINPPREEVAASAEPHGLTEVSSVAETPPASEPQANVTPPTANETSPPSPASGDHPVGALGLAGRPRPALAGGPTAGLEHPERCNSACTSSRAEAPKEGAAVH